MMGVSLAGVLAVDALPLLAEEFRANLTRPGRGISTLNASANDRCLWQCSECSLIWPAQVASRTYLGSGCSRCAYRRTGTGTSRFEYEVAAVLAVASGLLVETDAWVSVPPDRPLQFDLRAGGLYVELDSYRWHQDQLERDIRKTDRAAAAGLDVVRVRCDRLPGVPGAVCVFAPGATKEASPWAWAKALRGPLEARGAEWRDLPLRERQDIRKRARSDWEADRSWTSPMERKAA